MKNKKIIAYLAPEIPALSATFVYQEILELKKLNIDIRPVSIHRPSVKAESDVLINLASDTFYLYEQPFSKVVSQNLFLLLSSPLKYLSALKMALVDALSVGVFSHIGKGLLYRFIIAAGFVSYLKENDIEHIHSNFAHIPTDIAMYAAALYGIEFSFISHANDLFERGWLLKEKVERSKFAVTISSFNKDFLVNKGSDKNKINVIHCGVNTTSFSNRGIKDLDSPPMLGALGRMVEKKGFDILIQACDILKRKGIIFKLQLAGGGPLKQELEALTIQNNLVNEIKFIDSISHKDVPDWIKSLDVFVLPCQKDKNGDMDGIPVVLMESMLSGVPVLTTRISGIPELVEDGKTGLLCEPHDAECIAMTVESLLSDSAIRSDLCEKAILKVQAEFELNTNVQLLAKKLTE
jgi:colanic acid/amylovoran biosynthesis glycosyltransferase